MIYALWDTEGRNIIGTYDTEAEALQIVRGAAERFGTDYVDTMALVQEDKRGRSTTLAMGESLVERARALSSKPPLLTTRRG